MPCQERKLGADPNESKRGAITHVCGEPGGQARATKHCAGPAQACLERGPVCVLRDPTHHAFQDSSVGSATMRESRSENSVQDEEILRQAKRTRVVMLQQQEADADLMISQMLI